MTAVVRRMSQGGRGPTVVALQKTRLGLHAGITYRLDAEDERFLHLASHLVLKNRAPPVSGYWVESRLGRAKKLAVANQAALVSERYRDGSVPYGFGLYGLSIAEDGTLDFGGAAGLTCASLVHVVFQSAGVPLVALESWGGRTSSRKKADDAVQWALVEDLRAKFPKQAERVEKEVGCTRLRSEEVAASTGLEHRPVEFKRAEVAGRDVLAQVKSLVKAT